MKNYKDIVNSEDIIYCGKIYDKLIDETSRILYKRKINSYLGVGINRFNFTEGILMPEKYTFRGFDWFYNSFPDMPDIIIYGAGDAGLFTVRELLSSKKYREKVKAICDRNYNQIVTVNVLGREISVISPKEAAKCKNTIFFVCSIRKESRLDMFLTLTRDNQVDRRFVFIEHEIAKKDYEGQYFDVLVPNDDEIFMDCGCYDAFTSLKFSRWCNQKYERIYAFEPSSAQCRICEENIGKFDLKNITLFNAGVSGNSGESFFSDTENASSRLTGHGEQVVRTVKIDDVLNGERVSFIKMDIEGAELDAIEGASATIERYKPTLAICIYHKNCDIFKIPKRINELCDSYRFGIRMYTNWGPELVLYAIPDNRMTLL